MNKRNSKDILNQIVLVSVDFSIWGGYKQTTESDLQKMQATLPGGGVITKGSKKIYPGDSFTPFNSLKKEISRKLASIGVGALGGSARIIPNDQVSEVQTYLDDCKSRFNALLQVFRDNYDTTLESHLNSITEPVVREIVERSVLVKSDAVSRFRLNTDVFKIIPDGDGDSLVNNLATKLLDEIATAARDAYEKSFQGKPRVAQRALNQVIAIRNKLAGLVVLDGQNIEPIVDSLDDVLNVMPKEGWIEGVQYSALIGLVHMLCEPESMLKHAEKIQQGKASANIFTQTALAENPVNTLFDEPEQEQDTSVQTQITLNTHEEPVTTEENVAQEIHQSQIEAVVSKDSTEVDSKPETTTVQPQLTLVEATQIETDDEAIETTVVPLPIAAKVIAPKKVATFF